jgi:glycerophosphoryl diester phosphodiesterase
LLATYLTPIIAHRGASALAPENTAAAFGKAYDLGAKWVEFDVMLASCGEAVIIHDETLERTTNGHGYVRDYPYHYLKTLDAGSWFSPAFAGEVIPTLAEILNFLQQHQMMANIEIKPALGKEEETVKKVLAVVEEYWQSNLPLLISSFSYKVRSLVRRYSASSLLACLMHEWQPEWKKAGDKLGCVAMDINQNILNPARASEIKAAGRLLLAYTVDDPDRTRQLFAWGVDAVFSNCSEQMHGFLR